MDQPYDLGKFEREVGRYINWLRRNAKKRTKRGLLQGLAMWLKKAEEYEARDNAGNNPALPVEGSIGVHNGHVLGPMANKLAAYRAFLAKNPRQAQEYLERQPERVRKAIEAAQ